MNRSKKYTLNIRDISHGFITAFISASFAGIITSLSAGNLPTLDEVKVHALIGLSAGLGYLFKKWISNSDGKFAGEPKKTLQ